MNSFFWCHEQVIRQTQSFSQNFFTFHFCIPNDLYVFARKGAKNSSNRLETGIFSWTQNAWNWKNTIFVVSDEAWIFYTSQILKTVRYLKIFSLNFDNQFCLFIYITQFTQFFCVNWAELICQLTRDWNWKTKLKKLVKFFDRDPI